MPTTKGGIEYEEMPGSPTWGANPWDAPTGQREFKVASKDVTNFILEIGPIPTEVGRGWHWEEPASFPGKRWLVAVGYGVKPFDPDKTSGTWRPTPLHATSNCNELRVYPDAVGWIVTVYYGVPPYDTVTDWTSDGSTILCEEARVYSAEMLKLGIAGWKWKNDKSTVKSEDQSIGKLVPQTEYSVVWRYVPRSPFKTIAKTLGCVNRQDVLLDRVKLFDAPQETLLFIGAEVKRSYVAGAAYNQIWTISYKFVQRWVQTSSEGKDIGTPIGWNHVFRNDINPPDWHRVYFDRDGTEEPIYALRPFAPLFEQDMAPGVL